MKQFLFCLLLFAFKQLSAQPIPVADQTFKVDGTHEFAYAFAAGDKVDLHVQLIAGRRLKVVEFLQYPDRSLFRSYELDTVLNKRIQVPQTGLYILRITESGMGKKICRFTLQRSPDTTENIRLDTHVNWDWKTNPLYQIARRKIPAGTKTDVVSLGGSVTVKGSKLGLSTSTNAYQFTLPPNTARWAYRVSVGQATQDARRRDKEKVTAALKTGGAKLIGYEPTSALAMYALGMAIDLTYASSGETVEYAIVNGDNLPKFVDGKPYDTYIYQTGVSVDAQRRYSPLEGTYYFALRNKNWVDNIDVTVDIEAVTETPLFTDELYLEQAH